METFILILSIILVLCGFYFWHLFGVNISNNFKAIIGYILIGLGFLGIVYFAINEIANNLKPLMPH
jgi:hypothetical protein